MDDPDVILASTETPIVGPSSQWFGSGLGQRGSTSNDGACGARALRGSRPFEDASADDEDGRCHHECNDDRRVAPRVDTVRLVGTDSGKLRGQLYG